MINQLSQRNTFFNGRAGRGLYLYRSNPAVANTILWNDAPQEITIAGGGSLAVAARHPCPRSLESWERGHCRYRPASSVMISGK